MIVLGSLCATGSDQRKRLPSGGKEGEPVTSSLIRAGSKCVPISLLLTITLLRLERLRAQEAHE
jgi:hypothetical protein